MTPVAKDETNSNPQNARHIYQTCKLTLVRRSFRSKPRCGNNVLYVGNKSSARLVVPIAPASKRGLDGLGHLPAARKTSSTVLC